MSQAGPQQILDEQGYVVVACILPRKVGTVDRMTVDESGAMVAVLIAGTATYEDWKRQCERFDPKQLGTTAPSWYFYKAVAE